MANPAFTIDISDAINSFERLKKRSRNTKPLMANIAEHLIEGVLTNFENEQGPDGPWPALDPDTIAQRKRGTKDHKPSWPGNMLDRGGQAGLASAFFSRADSDSAQVGNNKIYAPIQFLGGTPDMPPGPADIPARNPLWVNDETQREIDEEIDDWFDEV